MLIRGFTIGFTNRAVPERTDIGGKYQHGFPQQPIPQRSSLMSVCK
jgi:hypothetical protein